MTRTPKFPSRHLLAKILTCVAIAGTIAIAFHPLQIGLAKSKQDNAKNGSKGVEQPTDEDSELMQWWNEDINAPEQPVAVPQKPPAKTGPQPSVFMERDEKDKPAVKHRFELPIPVQVAPKPQVKPESIPHNNQPQADKRPASKPSEQKQPVKQVTPVAIPQPNSPQPKNISPQNLPLQNNKPADTPGTQPRPAQQKPALMQNQPEAPVNQPPAPSKTTQKIQPQLIPTPKPAEQSRPSQQQQATPEIVKPIIDTPSARPSKPEKIKNRKPSVELPTAEETKPEQKQQSGQTRQEQPKNERTRNKSNQEKSQPDQKNAEPTQKPAPTNINNTPAKEISKPEEIKSEKPNRQKSQKRKKDKKPVEPQKAPQPAISLPKEIIQETIQAVPASKNASQEEARINKESKKSRQNRKRNKQEPSQSENSLKAAPTTQNKLETAPSEQKAEPKQENKIESKRQKKRKKEKSFRKIEKPPVDKPIKTQQKLPVSPEGTETQSAFGNQPGTNQGALVKPVTAKSAHPKKAKKEQKKPDIKLKPEFAPTAKRPSIQNIPPIFHANPVIPGIANNTSKSTNPTPITNPAQAENQQVSKQTKQEKTHPQKASKQKKQRSSRHAQHSAHVNSQPLATPPQSNPPTLVAPQQTTLPPSNEIKIKTANEKLSDTETKSVHSQKKVKREKRSKEQIKAGPEIVVFSKPMAKPATQPTSNSIINGAKPVAENVEKTEPLQIKESNKTTKHEKKSKKAKKQKVKKVRLEKPEMAPQIHAFPTAEAPAHIKPSKSRHDSSRPEQTSQPQVAQPSSQPTNASEKISKKEATTGKANNSKTVAQAKLEATLRKQELRKEKERKKEERRREKAARKAQQKQASAKAKKRENTTQSPQSAPAQQSTAISKVSPQLPEKESKTEKRSQKQSTKHKKNKVERNKEYTPPTKVPMEAPAVAPTAKEAINSNSTPIAANNSTSVVKLQDEIKRKEKTRKKKEKKAKKNQVSHSESQTSALKTNESIQTIKTPVEAEKDPAAQAVSKPQQIKKQKKSKAQKQKNTSKEQSKVSTENTLNTPLAKTTDTVMMSPASHSKQAAAPNENPSTRSEKVKQPAKSARIKKQKKSKPEKHAQNEKQATKGQSTPTKLPQPTLAGSLPLNSNQTTGQSPSSSISAASVQSVQSKDEATPVREKKSKKKSKEKKEKTLARAENHKRAETQPTNNIAAPIPPSGLTQPEHSKNETVVSPKSKPTEETNKKFKKKKSKKERQTNLSTPQITPELKSNQPVKKSEQVPGSKLPTEAVTSVEKVESQPSNLPLQTDVASITPKESATERTILSVPEASPASKSEPSQELAPAVSPEGTPPSNTVVPLEKPADAPAIDQPTPDSPQAKAAAYASAFQTWQHSAKPQRFDPIFHKGQEAAAAILKAVDTIDEAGFEALRKQMPGYLMIRNEIIVVAPDPAHFKELMKKHGTPVDIAFFDLMTETLNGYWPTTMEQRSDLSGCTRFGSQDLVRLYGGWTNFQKRYPGAYRQALQDPNLPLLSDIEDQLVNSQAACDGPSSVIDELKSFITRYPQASITPKLRKRLQDLQRSHFDMVFYQGVKYNQDR